MIPFRTQSDSKRIILIGSTTYLLLLILAIVFYKERTIILDMAFHSFLIIKSKTFAIQYNRFGAIFTQLFPVTAVKLGLSLKSILIIYSSAFIIYQFICYLIASLYFKNLKIALSMLLFSTLLVTHTFYWIQSEFIQGCMFVILFYGYLIKKRTLENFNPIEFSIYFIMILIIAFFHPLMAVPFLYMGIFFLLSKENYISSKLIYTSLWSLVMIIIGKNILFPPVGYDATRTNSITYFIQLFPDYFSLKINKAFLKFCLTDYYFLILFLFGAIGFYIKKREIKKLCLLLLFFFGFLLLVNVTTYVWVEQFYLESFYLCLGLFVIIPVVFDIIPTFKKTNLVIAGLALILIIRVIHIGLTHTDYTSRLAWNTQLLKDTEKSKEKKLIFPTRLAPMNLLKLSWGSSYELLLLSSINNPDSSRCIIIEEDPKTFANSLNKNKHFFGTFETFGYDELPKKYFNLQDTSRYKIVE